MNDVTENNVAPVEVEPVAPELPETPVETAPEVKEPAPAPVKEKLGIKETLEAVDGLNLMVELFEGVYADKKLNWADFGVVLEKLREKDRITNAVEGLDMVDDEIKDIDMEELAAVGRAALPIALRLYKSIKGA